MRNLLSLVVAALLLGAANAHAQDPFILVSDVDDTVKITDVLHPDHALTNAVIGERVFAGMAMLYRQLLGPDSAATRLVFISGSPGILAHHVRETLDAAGFPAYQLSLRSADQLPMSVGQYKTRVLTLMYAGTPGRFLLIGDDTESDPETYRDFRATKPGQVLATYVRWVTGRSLPEGSTSFVTAFDIALREFQAGRLSEEQAVLVGQSTMAAGDRTFFPRFVKCPGPGEHPEPIPASLADIREKIEKRLAHACAPPSGG